MIPTASLPALVLIVLAKRSMIFTGSSIFFIADFDDRV